MSEELRELGEPRVGEEKEEENGQRKVVEMEFT